MKNKEYIKGIATGVALSLAVGQADTWDTGLSMTEFFLNRSMWES